MKKTCLFTALLLVAALAPPNATAAPPNECRPSGTTDPSGNPVAPPCVTVQVPDAACQANKQLCLTYYVMLIPDRDGNLSQFNLDDRIVWQENNNCAGLQRAAGTGCFTADKVVAM